MWQTVDYKGNTVKWYEAELIRDMEEVAKNEYKTILEDCVSSFQ